MSSKNTILNNVRRHTKTLHDMPVIRIAGVEYTNPVNQFIETVKTVGGEALLLNGNDINDTIKSLYPNSENIASNLPEVRIATINPEKINDPHNLNGIDLAIVKGEIAVAENGAVWIPQNVKDRALYFIAEYLIIILDKKNIVNNMHEAYKRIEFNKYGFGVFISGPSKTADIEQALVIGAHGAKGLTVILK